MKIIYHFIIFLMKKFNFLTKSEKFFNRFLIRILFEKTFQNLSFQIYILIYFQNMYFLISLYLYIFKYISILFNSNLIIYILYLLNLYQIIFKYWLQIIYFVYHSGVCPQMGTFFWDLLLRIYFQIYYFLYEKYITLI